MTVAIAEYTQRPKRSLQADGLMDVAIGLSILCISLILLNGIYMQAFIATHASYTPNQPDKTAEYTHANVMSMIRSSIIQLSTPLPFFAAQWLKRRFVYPRTGYVLPRTVPKNPRAYRAIILIPALAVALLIAVMASSAPLRFLRLSTSDLTTTGIGIAFAIGLIVNFLIFGFVRHLIVAAITIAASMAVVTMPFDWEHKQMILSLIVGVSMFIAGTVPFANLLRIPIILEQATE